MHPTLVDTCSVGLRVLSAFAGTMAKGLSEHVGYTEQQCIVRGHGELSNGLEPINPMSWSGTRRASRDIPSQNGDIVLLVQP